MQIEAVKVISSPVFPERETEKKNRPFNLEARETPWKGGSEICSVG